MHDGQIKNFYSEVSGLKEKMSCIDIEIKDRKKRLGYIINEIDDGLKKQAAEIHLDYKGIKLNDFVGDLLNILSESVSSWRKAEIKLLNDFKFRDEFNNSLLIIIYGKVKAGKSRLGNYVADSCGPHDVPAFFKYDETGKRYKAPRLEELEKQRFDVKSTECTNAIQGFKLPGLSWIDTPGLLSLTKENGELAKKYIEAADLILYPMSTDSPGRNTDNNEVFELAKKGKEFCVLITKSDCIDEDEVNGVIVSKIVNKSDEDRKKQEDYVRSVLGKLLNSGQGFSGVNNKTRNKGLLGDILSISVETAEEYKINHEEWERSNIPRFYGMLCDIIKKDSVRLKTEQPVKNFKALVSNCLLSENSDSSICSIIKRIEIEIESLKNKRKNVLLDIRNNLLPGILESCEIEVKEAVYESYENRDSSKQIVQRLSNIINDTIKQKLEPYITEVIKDIVHEFESCFPKYELPDGDFSFETRFKRVKHTDGTLTKGIGSATGGTVGTIVGGIIGNIILPGFGAAIGAFLGGYLGSEIGKLGGKLCESETVHEVPVGDNFEEIEKRTIDITEKELLKIMDGLSDRIDNGIIAPLIESLGIIRNFMKEKKKLLLGEID